MLTREYLGLPVKAMWGLITAVLITFSAGLAYAPVSPPTPLIEYSYLLVTEDGFECSFHGGFTVGSENEYSLHRIVDKRGASIQRTILGKLKYTDITLRHPVSTELTPYFWEWASYVLRRNDEQAMKDFSILMLDPLGNPVIQWDFTSGWPSGITFSGTETPFEEITITVESMIRVH